MKLYVGTLFIVLVQLDCRGDTSFEPISGLTRWTGERNAASLGGFTECGKLCVSTVVTAPLSLLAHGEAADVTTCVGREYPFWPDGILMLCWSTLCICLNLVIGVALDRVPGWILSWHVSWQAAAC